MPKSFIVRDLVTALNEHRDLQFIKDPPAYHIKKTERWDWLTDTVMGWGGVYEIERGHNGPIVAVLEFDFDHETDCGAYQQVNGFFPTDNSTWFDLRIILDVTGWTLPNLGGENKCGKIRFI